MGTAPDSIKRLIDRFDQQSEQCREIVHEDRVKVAGQTEVTASWFYRAREHTAAIEI